MATPPTTALTANTCTIPCQVPAAKRPAADVEVIAQGASSPAALPAPASFALDPADRAPLAFGVVASPPLLALRSYTILRI
jgi:hypothetical protein